MTVGAGLAHGLDEEVDLSLAPIEAGEPSLVGIVLDTDVLESGELPSGGDQGKVPQVGITGMHPTQHLPGLA